VLGNFAYEEGVLETLRDARRFLAPGGVLIPERIVQWAAPVTSDRFERDFESWRDVGYGLDFTHAEHLSRNNMYVFAIEPGDLLGPAAAWDSLAFGGEIDSRRTGRVEFAIGADVTVFGFALWWECTLAADIVLSTSPFGPRTHWDQIYLPTLAPLECRARDVVTLEIESETSGEAYGIDVRWAIEQRRGDATLARQELDIGSGYLD
jgi:protein arginine N-methyltransferase 1